MRYLRLRVTHTEDTRHPIHAFEMRHDDFRGSELLHWNVSPGGTSSMIFRVRGDPDTYRELLEARDETLAYSVTPAREGTFYCCVCERLTDRTRTYVTAVARGTAVALPPVRYNRDGTVDVSVVGSSADLDGVVETFPDGIGVEVRSVGDYRTHANEPSTVLTARQHEAVEAAVDCGYYDSPRRATMDEIGARLDVTPSTAAEHLRKAEKRVMRRVLDGR